MLKLAREHYFLENMLRDTQCLYNHNLSIHYKLFFVGIDINLILLIFLFIFFKAKTMPNFHLLIYDLNQDFGIKGLLVRDSRRHYSQTLFKTLHSTVSTQENRKLPGMSKKLLTGT